MSNNYKIINVMPNGVIHNRTLVIVMNKRQNQNQNTVKQNTDPKTNK
jgi:hypothetical protein